MVDGWIKLHRALLEWEWYDDIPSKVLFIHLLLKCNHADGNYRGRKVLRGQRWTSIGHLAKETGLTVKQIRAAIEKLESTGEICTQGASDGTMLTVCKYDSYQEIPKQKGKQKDEQRASEGQADGQTKGNKQEEQEQFEEGQERKEALIVPPTHPLITWIENNAPTVQRLKQPLTNEQADKLMADLEITTDAKKNALKEMLLSMENYVPLVKTSKSANLTIRKWWLKQGASNIQSGGHAHHAQEKLVIKTGVHYK